MKQSAMLHRCLTAATLAVALSLFVLGAPAQNATSAPAAQQQKAPADDGIGPRIDLKVQDLTVGQVVEVLRKKFANTNFVLGPGVEQVPVKDLNLRQMNIVGVLEALKYATDGQIAVAPISGGWAIQARPASTEVEAFNLTGYLQSFGGDDQKKAEDALKQLHEIVLSTVNLLRERSPVSIGSPEMQFHRGANLLVVVGSPRAIDVVRKVVNALPGQQSFQPGKAPGSPGMAVPPPSYDKLIPNR